MKQFMGRFTCPSSEFIPVELSATLRDMIQSGIPNAFFHKAFKNNIKSLAVIRKANQLNLNKAN